MADKFRKLYDVIVIDPREERVLARETVFGDDEKKKPLWRPTSRASPRNTA